MKSLNNPLAIRLHIAKQTKLHRLLFMGLATMSVTLLLILLLTNKASAQFTPGKLAVLIVGDGSGSLSSAAAPIFVKEFNTSGTGQTGTLRASLPSTAAASTLSVDRALTQSGSATSEGFLNLSNDGQFLVLAGYNCNSGTSSVANSSATAFPTNCRVVGKIGINGTPDTKTTLYTSAGGNSNNIRSAASKDGTAFWIGAPTGIWYVINGNVASGGVTSLSSQNSRMTGIFNSQLYFSTQSGSSYRLGTVGSGLPTSGSPTLANLSNYPTTSDNYGYSFIDIDGNGTPDVLYIANFTTENPTAPGLYKYIYNTSTSKWVASGSLTGTGAFSVTAVYKSCTSSADIYYTGGTSSGKPVGLYKYTDSNPASGTLSGTLTGQTLLASPASNTAFGGVSFTPATNFNVPTAYTVTGGGPYCFGSSASIGLGNSQTGVNYQLYNGASTVGFSVAGTGSAISFGTQTAVGTYTISAANALTACTTTMTGSVIINTQPSLATISNQSLCNGQSLNLATLNPTDINGTAGGTYIWSSTQGGTALGSTTVSPGVGTTTYWVRYTKNSCYADQSVGVVVSTQPSLATIPNQSLCTGQSLNLTTLNPADNNGTTGGTYIWSSTQGGTALGSTTVSPGVGTTTYWVRYAKNSCYADQNVSVVVHPGIILSAAQDQCYTATGNNAFVLVTASGGFANFSWSGTPQIPVAGGPTVIYKETAGSASGAHIYTVTDVNNCTASISSPAITGALPTNIVLTTSTGISIGDCYSVSLNDWTTIYDPASGNAIIAWNDHGQNIGLLTASVDVESNAISVNNYSGGNGNCYQYPEFAMKRHFVIASNASQPFATPIDLRLFITHAGDLSDLTTWSVNTNPPYGSQSYLCALNDDVHSLADVCVTRYEGPNVDFNYSNNSPNSAHGGTGTYTLYSNINSSITRVSGGTPVTGFQSLYSGGTSNVDYVQISTNHLSEFWLHGSAHGSPLPVELISFTANAQDNSFIRLDWATAVEINNAGFDMERSDDGKAWSNIGWFEGHGNTTTQNNYYFNDMNVNPGAVYYYRLKQTDFDGAFKYSNVASAEIRAGNNNWLVYPNPVQNMLTITGGTFSDGETRYNLFDTYGKLIVKNSIVGDARKFDIDTRAFSSGIYVLEITNGNTVKALRFVKE